MKFNNFISISYLTILIVAIAILAKPNAFFTQGFYGMVKVDKNLWVDDSEITNGEYRQFINYIKDSIARRKLFDNGFKEFGTKFIDQNGKDSIKLNFETPLDWKSETYFDILDSFYPPQERSAIYYPYGVESKHINYAYINNGINEEIIINCFPDTTVWESDRNYQIFEFYSYYNWHIAYDNYPVLGITYNQAMAFCHWRTKMFNDFNASSHKNATKRVVKYTLPTLEQWNSISKMGNVGSQFNDTLKPQNKSKKKHFSRKEASVNSRDFPSEVHETFLVQVIEFDNKIKIYGLADNVSEITLDKYVVGGSWFQPKNKAVMDTIIEHDCSVATPWLGFRCVVYYIE